MTKQTETAILQYIDSLIDNSAPDQPVWNIEKIRSGEKNRWNYIDGCMITAVLSLYEITKDEKYLAFADDFVGYFIEENGNIRTYDGQDMNLDDINAGRNLFPLYDLTGKEKYRKAMETLREQLRHQPRTKAGNIRYGWMAFTWPSPFTCNMRQDIIKWRAAGTVFSSFKGSGS